MESFKLLGKEAARADESRVSFNIELSGADAVAFKKAVEDAKVNQKNAAHQMIRFCLKDAGYLKAE